jgi:hypothetical protein
MHEEFDPRDYPWVSDDPDVTLRRVQWMWRGCLLLPFLYLILAFLMDHFWFVHRNDLGLWPFREAQHGVAYGIYAALVLAAQAGMVWVRRQYVDSIIDARLRPPLLSVLIWKRSVRQFICADLISFLALMSFLMDADWNALTVLCFCSYLLYAQAYPHITP